MVIRMAAVTALLMKYIARLTTMMLIFLTGRLFQKVKTSRAYKPQLAKIKGVRLMASFELSQVSRPMVTKIKHWPKEKMMELLKKRTSLT